MHHEDSRRSVVVKRTGHRFFEMFQQRYESAFPDLFQPFEAMPEELLRHIRYPEDLFLIQRLLGNAEGFVFTLPLLSCADLCFLIFISAACKRLIKGFAHCLCISDVT